MAVREALRTLLLRTLLPAALIFASGPRLLRATQMQTTHADYPPFSLSCMKAQCGSINGRSDGSLFAVAAVAAAASASIRSSSIAAGAAVEEDEDWVWRVQPQSLDLVSSAGEYLSACVSAVTAVATGGNGSNRHVTGGGGGLLRQLQDDIATYFNDRCLTVVGSRTPSSAGAGNYLGDEDQGLDPFAIDSAAIESAARRGGCLADNDSLAAVSVRYRCERRSRRDGFTTVSVGNTITTAKPPSSSQAYASLAGKLSDGQSHGDGGTDLATDSESAESTAIAASHSAVATTSASSMVYELSPPGVSVVAAPEAAPASTSEVPAAAAPEAAAAPTSDLAAAAAHGSLAATADRNGSESSMVQKIPQLAAVLDGLATADVVAAAAVPAVLFLVVIVVVVTAAVICWRRRLILVVRFSSHPSTPPSSTAIAAVVAPDAEAAAEASEATQNYVAAEQVCATSAPVRPAVPSSERQLWCKVGRGCNKGPGVRWCWGCCTNRGGGRGRDGSGGGEDRSFHQRMGPEVCRRRAAPASGSSDVRSAPQRRAVGDGNSYAEIDYGDADADSPSSAYDDPALGGRAGSAADGGAAFASSEHVYHIPLDCGATSDQTVAVYCATAATTTASLTVNSCCDQGMRSTQRSSSSPALSPHGLECDAAGVGACFAHLSHSCDASGDASSRSAPCPQPTAERQQHQQRHLEAVRPPHSPDALPDTESLPLPWNATTAFASQRLRPSASAFLWPPPPALPPPPPPPPRLSSFANAADGCYFTLESDIR